MSSYLEKLKSAYKLNPVTLKAKAYRLLAYVGILAVVLSLAYCQGVSHTNDKWEAKYAKQEKQLADVRAQNAVDSAMRFGDYIKRVAAQDSEIEKAKQSVHEYYKANPVVRKVLVDKLVPVEGDPLYVYVPDGVCPNDFFGADELRLWNQGNKRVGDSK